MAVLAGAAGLLERAVGYGLECVEMVATALLPRPTPCAEWDLYSLLLHVNDSIGALQEGIDAGCISLLPPEDVEASQEQAVREAGGDPAAALVAVFRCRTERLLSSWDAAQHDGHHIAVEGLPLAAELVAITGSIEIAVHGWDIAAACGGSRPIPARLAADMLVLSQLVVGDGPQRHPLFAAPVAVSRGADPSERLLAFLGRSPIAVI